MRSPRRLLPELAGFAAILAAAWTWNWAPGDLAWGMWVAGFVSIAVYQLILSGFWVTQKPVGVIRTLGVLGFTALAIWALSWVYRFYGDLLDLGFPLLPDPDRVYVGGVTWHHVRPFAFWPTMEAGMKEFYLMVLVSLWPLCSALYRAWPNEAEFRRDPGLSGGVFLRMHLTVMALIGLQILLRDASSRHAFVFTAALLALNYFPWHRFGRPVGSERAAVTAP